MSERTPPVNLDLLALALICCLLTSVVGVLVLADATGAEPDSHSPREAEPRMPPAEQLVVPSDPVEVLNALSQRSRRLRTQVENVVQLRATVVGKLQRASVEESRQDLETRIVAIERKLSLIDSLREADEEAARLRAAAKMASAASDSTGPLGDYHGPYVLLECVEGSAILHPGETRIEMEPTPERLATVVAQIEEAGFVALAVRPSGWYNNSFDRLRTRIYKQLDDAERKGARHVGRTTFPVEAHESINAYLPARQKP